MLDQLYHNQFVVSSQSSIMEWFKILTPLYEKYVPKQIQNRRNVNQGKLSDVLLLSLLLWQVDLKMTVQTRFYRFLKRDVFKPGELPERSRFNRKCRCASCELRWIRFGVLNDLCPESTYTIIDSLPIPLCQGIRNHRAKVFQGSANIGYNATKGLYYYGFKGNFEVADNGIVLTYALTSASCHDIKAVKTLLSLWPSHQVLADLGYLSRKLKEELAKKEINLWTPVRRNMKQPAVNQQLLNRQRRRIETTFSQLNELFDIERMHVRSNDGLQLRLEQCLLVHTLSKLGIN